MLETTDAYTGSSNVTWITDSTGTYIPCWCGRHYGDYARHEWLQCHCQHELSLFHIADEHYICPLCGKDFYID